MRIIAVLNQKGGVGKTSLCHHLAGEFAGRGRRVLLVDLDPQASLTVGLLGPTAAVAIPPDETVLAALDPEGRPCREVARPTGIEGISLVAGTPSASAFNQPDPEAAEDDVQVALTRFLIDVDPDVELVLLDCPPNLMGISWAALAAADALVVPVEPDGYSLEALIQVRAFTHRCREQINPGLELAGYLLTKVVPRSRVHASYTQVIRDAFPGDVFDAVVPRLTAFSLAVMSRRPVCLSEPRGPAARAIEAVADELLTRISDDVLDGGEVVHG